MQWTVQQSAHSDETISTADYPHIRLFNVSREVGFMREEGKLATWELCSPATVESFSGVGYHFGKQLFEELDVPIGMINSSYGGSQAEAWTPREYLATSPDLEPCIAREKIWAAEREQVQQEFDQTIRAWKKEVDRAKENGTPPPREPRVPDALRDYRIAGSIYSNMIQPLVPFAIKGVTVVPR